MQTNRTRGVTRSSRKLLDDLRDLVAEVETLTANSVGETSSEVLESVLARLESTQEGVAALYHEAKDKVVERASSTDQMIRANPYGSLAIAAGIGLVAGVILGRQRD